MDGSAHIKRAEDGVHIDMEFPNLVVRLTKEQARKVGTALLGMSMSHGDQPLPAPPDVDVGGGNE
ncbi:hypothetical protein [Acetobacter orientalis]|uniref:hypothetical protein n=1 Tax=Acetobacter orientalis TaxID=146474 RepID=UPI00248EDCD7|nr:hypothetical protein [Acetobacter orientalis]